MILHVNNQNHKEADIIAVDNYRETSIKLSSHDFRQKKFPEQRYYGKKFVRWAKEAESQRFGYTGIDAFGEILQCQGNISYRWSAERRKRNLALIYSFADSLPTDWDIWFLTLTVQHPSRHTYPAQTQAINDIRSAWSLFRQKLRKYRYLRVIEPGERNGFAHIHMVLGAPASEAVNIQALPTAWVCACNAQGNDAIEVAQSLQLCEDIQNVGAYVSKYLTKTLEVASAGDDTLIWRWIEVCYRIRLRCVAMDATSRTYIKSKYASSFSNLKGIKGEWMKLEAF